MIYENYVVENPVKELNFDLSTVKEFYVGKDNWCRCGCGGTYYTHADKAWKRMLNQFNKLLATGCVRVIEQGSTYINVPFGPEEANKCYCFYFEE